MVSKTTDYDMFKFGPWNRNISEKNLHKIDKDVEKNGWKCHPIMVNGNYEVIDGQHRLVYAKTHGLPVYYIVVEDLTAEDCVTMNNTRTSWNLLDFIKLYASQGNESYIRIQKILNTYSFAPASLLLALVKGNTASGNVGNKIRRGDYKLTEKELYDIKLKFDYLSELAPYIKAVKGRTTAIYQAVSFCYDEETINNTRLKKQIKNKIETITPPANMDMALKEIDYIYNYGIRREDVVDIIALYKKHAREQMMKGAKTANQNYRDRKNEERRIREEFENGRGQY